MAQHIEPFEATIRRAIQTRIEEIAKEEAVEAAKRVEKRVREDVGSIAAAIMSHFSFEKTGRELVIRVDFENTKTGI